MAIRFYCPFCDRLLGISDRKAGAAVVCPYCGGVVGVPRPGGPPPLPAGPVLSAGQAFVAGGVCVVLIGLAFSLGLLVGTWR